MFSSLNFLRPFLVLVDYRQYGREAIAVLGGISLERGVDLMLQFKKAVNIEKFKVWLDELRARYPFDDICLVMDNLAVHRSKAAIERIDELGFEYVFTPAYCPDSNPIESVFSIFKGELKKKRIKSILNGQIADLPRLIETIWQRLEVLKIAHCIVHVLKFLKIN